MALNVTHLKDRELMAGTLISDRRLWLTADKSRVVEQGDRDAATLLVAQGRKLRPDDQKQFGISEGYDGKLVIKARAKPEDKAKKAPEDKARRKKA